MQLLRKTIISYFAFSALLLLASVPVFYFALKSIVVNNADEHLRAIKTRIMPQLLDAAANRPGGSLRYADYEVIFQKGAGTRAGDSVYSLSISGEGPEERLPGRALASHFLMNQEWYSVEIKTSMVDKLALMQRIVLLLVVVLFCMLLGLLLVNKILSRKIWLPFYSTLQQLQQYRVDKHEPLALRKGTVKEFNDLNLAIEQLTERDRQVFYAQKEFAENASHEMQSPLAVFQSKLELLMQTGPLSEAQTALITDMANASKRMARLNKSLVLLTRIENNQFTDREQVSIKDSLENLVQQYDFQLQRKSLQVVFRKDADIVVYANKTLLEILLSNLLTNAIRHNVQGGRIEITIEAHALFIRNTGRQAALQTEKIFQRFQKESTDSGSLGLGLEIIRKICLLNRYTIRYQLESGLHGFSVLFPAQ